VTVALLALAALAPAARAAQHPGVLVVGDSLEELTSPYLARYLPGVRLTVNAVGGSNSFQILDLFRESYEPSQRVIVFDAGANDNPAYPQILEENLAKVAAAVGNRCMVVPTIHGFTVNGVDNTGKNRVVRAFAASRPGTQVPDWAGAVAAHPELLQSDGLHPIPQGAELRAKLIAQGVKACLAFEATRVEAQTPVLEAKPGRLQPVSKMERRREEVLRAAAAAVGSGAALALLRSF
jgi:lysophospholipase L1-like esterase